MSERAGFVCSAWRRDVGPCLLVVALAALAGCTPTTTTPKADADPAKVSPVKATTVPPDDWTHKELAEYLGTKGVKVKVVPGPSLSRPGRVAAGVGTPGDNIRLLVLLCDTPKIAKEEAGAMGGEAFSANRFAIGNGTDMGTPEQKARLDKLLKRISDALK